MVKKTVIMLSRFHLIPERYGQTDRRTDRQTDRIAISISRVSVLTRNKTKCMHASFWSWCSPVKSVTVIDRHNVKLLKANTETVKWCQHKSSLWFAYKWELVSMTILLWKVECVLACFITFFFSVYIFLLFMHIYDASTWWIKICVLVPRGCDFVFSLTGKVHLETLVN